MTERFRLPSPAELRAAVARCGTQSTGDFAGQYQVTWVRRGADDTPPLSHPEGRLLEELEITQFPNFEIRSDRIVSGDSLVQEFCLTRVLDRDASSLRSEGLWRVADGDPLDAVLVSLSLRRERDETTFLVSTASAPEEAMLRLGLVRR